ncbi:hypothetical protein RhiJN_19925 [Ceratobasidium sp. AG-Ba]|nr:hypothetical protein RhiJN_19925 [Ceratobasidium sp. AG-Ba]
MSTGPNKRPASRDLTPPAAPANRPSSTHPVVTQVLNSVSQLPPTQLFEITLGITKIITENYLASPADPELKVTNLDRCRRNLVLMIDRFDSQVFGPNPPPPKRSMCFQSCRNRPRSDISIQTIPLENGTLPLTTDPMAITAVPKADAATSTEDLSPEPPALTSRPDTPMSDPRPTYAEVAVSTLEHAAEPCPKPKSGPNPRHPPSFRIPPTSRPKAQPLKALVFDPIRLVVRPASAPFQQMPFAALLAVGPAEPFRLLSHALSLSPISNSVTLLGVHQNRSKNLIVSLPHGTSDDQVDAVTTVIHSAYTPRCAFPLSVSRDVAWTKLMVSSVPARSKPGDPTYSEEEVRSSFLLNPAVKALSIMRNPRWIRNPASITGAHSSFTFSFQDPDGSLGRSLAKSCLFVFGEPVHLKRWTDKPRRTGDIPQA